MHKFVLFTDDVKWGRPTDNSTCHKGLRAAFGDDAQLTWQCPVLFVGQAAAGADVDAARAAIAVVWEPADGNYYEVPTLTCINKRLQQFFAGVTECGLLRHNGTELHLHGTQYEIIEDVFNCMDVRGAVITPRTYIHECEVPYSTVVWAVYAARNGCGFQQHVDALAAQVWPHGLLAAPQPLDWRRIVTDSAHCLDTVLASVASHVRDMDPVQPEPSRGRAYDIVARAPDNMVREHPEKALNAVRAAIRNAGLELEPAALEQALNTSDGHWLEAKAQVQNPYSAASADQAHWHLTNLFQSMESLMTELRRLRREEDAGRR